MIDAEYIGWIPCVGGKLYFNHFECGLGAKRKVAEINHVDYTGSDKRNYTRNVIISSIVDWKDSKEKEKYGKFHVTLLGQAHGPDGDFEGKIFLLPYKYSKSSGHLASIKSLIGQYESAVLEESELTNYYLHLYKKLDEFENAAYFKVLFKVERSGITYLKYAGDYVYKYPHELTVARQCFYYLKYSIHMHQHHKGTDDSITTVHGVKSIGDKEKLGPVMLNDLKESLVIYKRSISERDNLNVDAKGILSYGLSLLQTCKRSGLISSFDFKNEKQYLLNLLGSIEASLDRSENETRKKIKRFQSIISILLFYLAVIAPITLIRQNDIRTMVLNNSFDSDSIIVKGVAYFSSDQASIVVLALISCFTVFAIFYQNHWSIRRIVKLVPSSLQVFRGGFMRKLLIAFVSALMTTCTYFFIVNVASLFKGVM